MSNSIKLSSVMLHFIGSRMLSGYCSATQRGLVYRALVASSVLIGSSVGAAELRDVIPEHFRGAWAGSWMHCTFGGESTLTIGERTVDFYESRGRVLSIATEGDTELGLLIEATGEGQTWLTAIKFTLSEDHQTLFFSWVFVKSCG
jgi:hypothetical protein